MTPVIANKVSVKERSVGCISLLALGPNQRAACRIDSATRGWLMHTRRFSAPRVFHINNSVSVVSGRRRIVFRCPGVWGSHCGGGVAGQSGFALRLPADAPLRHDREKGKFFIVCL